MKKLLIALCLLITPFLYGQDINGAWTTVESDDKGYQVEHTLIFTESYFSEAIFEKPSGKFLGTKGGSYSVSEDDLNLTYEYDSRSPGIVGNTKIESFTIAENNLELGKLSWTKIDNGTPGDLFGAWLISGRKRDGEIVQRDTSGPRKTMKILSGTRFQWIAFNTETKEFMGTGGGTYTTINGKYTENIGFFSRDDSRVGASLEFNYELKDGDWHHSGLSSKGKPIYEVWSKRTQ
ncbi:membrane or secreted protein [Flagellimonas lutimaris]|uniref:membrane or secreted protein n=1 Tax=Flagellimonas lutimaris TaxID=475082 RepID=UPI000B725339|nr:MAG: membrane or secreted protein [Muricauda sp. TMED12]|tara:strand:- start:5598 stop:6302 length:705 start_codon:yes stop_codon:yes gene_type:complete